MLDLQCYTGNEKGRGTKTMKRWIGFALTLVMLFALCACGSAASTAGGGQETPAPENKEAEVSLDDLKQGDEVSIIGQKANSTLVNDKTIWVQVLRDGERTIIYYCQMKDEYIEEAGALKMLDVVKVKGNFLNVVDLVDEPENPLPSENTAIIVNLYDCELIAK